MTKLLNLPGVIVEDNQQTEDTLILFVKSDKKTAICSRCGQTSRHLPIERIEKDDSTAQQFLGRFVRADVDCCSRIL